MAKTIRSRARRSNRPARQRGKMRRAKKTLACDEYLEKKGRTKSKAIFDVKEDSAAKAAREEAEAAADTEMSVAIDKLKEKWKCDDEDCDTMATDRDVNTKVRCRESVKGIENGYECTAKCRWTITIECV
jgi:hypothetical protein